MIALTTTARLRDVYDEPTFDEMVGIARDFGLVSDIHTTARSVELLVLEERYEMTAEEAAIMLKGLLLGYFHSQTRNDLSLAAWLK